MTTTVHSTTVWSVGFRLMVLLTRMGRVRGSRRIELSDQSLAKAFSTKKGFHQEFLMILEVWLELDFFKMKQWVTGNSSHSNWLFAPLLLPSSLFLSASPLLLSLSQSRSIHSNRKIRFLFANPCISTKAILPPSIHKDFSHFSHPCKGNFWSVTGLSKEKMSERGNEKSERKGEKQEDL